MRKLVLLFVFLISAFASLSYFLGYFEPRGEQLTFVVQKVENFAQLASRLQKLGVIKSERALRWYVNLSAPVSKLKRGEFALFQNMPIPSVVYSLTEGKPIEYKITVPEGYNLFQIADLLESKGFCKKPDFLAAAYSADLVASLPTISSGQKNPKNIEGYIFPDTYLLQKVYSPKEIAQIMLQRFKDLYKSLEKEMEASATVRELKLTPHQVMILASIVEKETGAASERALIAGLFVNRLKKRMRLQTDPTVIYGTWVKQGIWDGNIRRKDLDAVNEYNTYQKDGLPVGPIANPGLNAIRAVLTPANTDYLYFVSRNDGTSIFSKDYKDHQKAVVQTQLKHGAKDGKSWRNLPEQEKAK